MSKLEMCSECHKYKDNLSGDGICVECERAFESDYSSIRHYDEELMKEILEEHGILFDRFFEAVGEKSKHQELLNKDKAKKVVKTENVSQACPVCKYPVNWKYCPNCGQRLKW
ncbi:hypothetical protein [Clostridium perfringens]|uniref:hypothetical protein n=1 Tax=Clostridium perfringens TaxID=1502 RepID=UPI001FA92B84|nr:hypothetical protein [Clostridium perfringens]